MLYEVLDRFAAGRMLFAKQQFQQAAIQLLPIIRKMWLQHAQELLKMV
jgi:hypothetical protein